MLDVPGAGDVRARRSDEPPIDGYGVDGYGVDGYGVDGYGVDGYGGDGYGVGVWKNDGPARTAARARRFPLLVRHATAGARSYRATGCGLLKAVSL